ncbi:MAG: GAF domain-containing protein [Candidatus Rokubacteria bacterium]|nr:GAF domain-containing protein [Candidatus Rokubacteria bacterium]
MSLHKLLPLVAFLLSGSLLGLSLARNFRSPLNRIFAAFAASLMLWNFGVFMGRRAPDPASAHLWEYVIHAGIIAMPALYYHFLLAFLDTTHRHRRTLGLVYGFAAAFTVVNATGSELFLRQGVIETFWGWAPVVGPLYVPFVVYFSGTLISGILRLVRAYRTMESSFRRNRALLILLGSFASLAGGFIDFARFILAGFFPIADQIYPMGIPGNMAFAVLLGTAMVRYRLFDVDVAVKKMAIYTVLGVGVTSLVVGVTRLVEKVGAGDVDTLWLVVPLALVITIVLSPFGRRFDDFIHRVMFTRRRGCYETLLALSRRMAGILDFGTLVDTLVEGLVLGIPVTHGVLLVFDEGANAFVVRRTEATLKTDEKVVAPLPAGSALVRWLADSSDGVLVKEEARVDPRLAGYFHAASADLEAIPAALVVPLRVEKKLIAILLIGEKLSGEIFDEQELEVLAVLANQTAISMENARLYAELGDSNIQLVKASRLKSQFLASMSHELRTPLNSIIGFSKVLLRRIDGGLTDRQETYVKSVHNSSTHLLELINSILDIARIEAGKVDIRFQDVDLGLLVDECIESSLPLLRGKAVKVEREVAFDLPHLDADRTKVKQILLNLLSNAIKATVRGRIVVRARPQDDAIHVSVADTGIGIRPEDLTRMFEPFERLDNPLARQVDGTGLGLAISRKFVELHGGRIWAESRENEGSTFHFLLPRHQAATTAGTE